MICSLATEGSGPTAAAALGAAALLAVVPLASPLVQIWLLAQKSKDDIEDTVRVKEPLQACSVVVCLLFMNARRCTARKHMARTALADHSSLSKMPCWLYLECVTVHPTLKVLNQIIVACRLIWSGLWSCGERMPCCSGQARSRR